MGLLKMLRAKGKGTNLNTLIHTYKTFIRPALEYACIIPVTSKNNSFLPHLCSTERNILRTSLNLNKQDPGDWLHQDLDIQPLQHRLTLLRAKYMHRLLLRSPPVITQLITPPTQMGRAKPKNKYIQPTTVAITNFRLCLPEDLQTLR